MKLDISTYRPEKLSDANTVEEEAQELKGEVVKSGIRLKEQPSGERDIESTSDTESGTPKLPTPSEARPTLVKEEPSGSIDVDLSELEEPDTNKDKAA